MCPAYKMFSDKDGVKIEGLANQGLAQPKTHVMRERKRDSP